MKKDNRIKKEITEYLKIINGYNIIPKTDLISHNWYLNANDGRGMRIGVWNDKREVFTCLEFGFFQFTDYEMKHIEDEKGNHVVFEPIVNITKEIVDKYPYREVPEPKDKC